MGSVLAIVSKKVFERDFGGAGVGEVVATARYASSHKTLEKLATGGNLYLVTVAAEEQLLLAGVLRAPKFRDGGWTAAANTVAVKDITALIGRLAFDTGHGITAKPGTLAMSLQTPRGLTDEDVVLLDGGAKSASSAKPAAKPAAPKPAKPAAPKPAKPTPAAKPSAAAKPAAPVAGADPDLASADADLAANRLVPALDALLRAWARCRSSEVAGLIDRLGAVLARSLPPITGIKTTIDGAWRDVGDQLRPVDVPRLVVALDLGSAPQAEGWLDILLRFPIDPRLCAPAIDMSLKFVSSSAGPTRTRAFKLAEVIADGRCLPQIGKLAGSRKDAWNWTELKARLKMLASRIAVPPVLPKPDAAIVKSIAAQITALAKQPAVPEAQLFAVGSANPDDGDRLLAQVLEAPHDDAPRLVYSDYLQERGDPRGELIALQSQLRAELTSAQEKRERALVRDQTNLKAWLGPLIAVVSDPVFERGFLTRCTAQLKSAKQRADLLAHPYWATVEHLTCDDLALVESPAMRSLESVSGLSLAHVAELATRKQPVRFQALGDVELDDLEDDVPVWTTILASRAFAKLRHLGPFKISWEALDDLGCSVAGWNWLLDSPCGKQLNSLALHFGRESLLLREWFEMFRSRRTLEQLEFRTGGFDQYVRRVFTLTRTQLVIALRFPEDTDARDLPPELLAGIDVPELIVDTMGKASKQARERLTGLVNTTYGKQFARVAVR